LISLNDGLSITLLTSVSVGYFDLFFFSFSSFPTLKRWILLISHPTLLKSPFLWLVFFYSFSLPPPFLFRTSPFCVRVFLISSTCLPFFSLLRLLVLSSQGFISILFARLCVYLCVCIFAIPPSPLPFFESVNLFTHASRILVQTISPSVFLIYFFQSTSPFHSLLHSSAFLEVGRFSTLLALFPSFLSSSPQAFPLPSVLFLT